MSTRTESKGYFDRIAGEWDALRAGYFTEAVRDAAIRKAYLRPEMVVADAGAGTGFMAAGLAPLVRRVYAFDGSPAMLDVARRNLAKFDNVVYQEAEGLSLPLPDESLDAVFANMYLHHCPDPLAAIREMSRLLRPGGRLVITDIDAHSYEWFKEEMADVWLGFERPQMREWYKQAGLVNIIVDCTGQSCCTGSQGGALTSKEDRKAQVSVFVAIGTRPVAGIAEAVQSRYGAVAQGQGSCCSTAPEESSASSCCSSAPEPLVSIEDLDQDNVLTLYPSLELLQVPVEASEIAMGCGNPLAMAALKPGETVLDIGSGGGLDSFIAARQLGPSGHVIGVDMTPAMLERARRTAQKSGYHQVEFRQGNAEALPVETGAIDVVISNCVINLTVDKGQAFREAYRVLKTGGRLEVSDIVTEPSFPLNSPEDFTHWAECVSGALPEGEYLDLIAQAGFQDIRVRNRVKYGDYSGVSISSLTLTAAKKD